jgi:hypothetical protein
MYPVMVFSIEKRPKYPPRHMLISAGTQQQDIAGLVHTLHTYHINISITTKRSLLYEM